MVVDSGSQEVDFVVLECRNQTAVAASVVDSVGFVAAVVAVVETQALSARTHSRSTSHHCYQSRDQIGAAEVVAVVKTHLDEENDYCYSVDSH